MISGERRRLGMIPFHVPLLSPNLIRLGIGEIYSAISDGGMNLSLGLNLGLPSARLGPHMSSAYVPFRGLTIYIEF